MTDLEREALDTLTHALSEFSARRLTVITFECVMGQMRDTKKHLENCALGCASGRHAGRCTCKEGKPGVCIHG